MNATGHMILFQMAYNNMTPEVQQRVTQILKDPNNPEENGYQTNARDDDVPSAATYPDVYKEDARKTHSGDPKSYDHFYNQPIGDPKYTAGKTAGSPNGLTMLAAQLSILRNPNSDMDSMADALRWTTHEYGDIGAQPGHCVNYYSAQFPKGDGGGNAFKLNWGSKGRWDTDLHALLDAGGAHAKPNGSSENNYKDLKEPLDAAGRAWIEKRAESLQSQFPRERYVTQVQDQNPQDWVRDLSAQAEKIWAEFTPGEKVSPSDPRLAGVEQTMNQNVAIAAYRLADLCNQLFSTSNAVAQSAAMVPPHLAVTAHAPLAAIMHHKC